MRSMSEKTVPALAFALAVALAASPALAQFAGGGGGDVPFQAGLGTLLNWAFVAGVVVALGAFIMACIGLFMRNLMAFAGGVLGVVIGGVLGVVIGGALMANASDVVSALTGLQAIF
jgi:hypothetical protein